MPTDTTPLLGDRPSDSKKGARAWLRDEITPESTDYVLLLGCLATGLLDASVFNVWSCFVSMQTGNTVYVGLGITGQPYSQPTRWIKSGTSILTFLLGSFLFSRLMTYLSPRTRLALITSTILQTVCTILPAILSSTGLVPANAGDLIPDSYIVLLPLSLLAIQSGGQCVLSRVLGYAEIPTVVLTSAYCDIGMDPKLFAGPTKNVKRNRRVGSAVLLILGAWLGGYLTRHGHIGRALWVVSGLKAVMALVWVVWPRPKGVQLE